MYHVTARPLEKLVRIDLVGPPEELGFASGRAELAKHVPRAKAGGQSFNLLLDMRHTSVLPQAFTTGAQEIIKWLAEQGMQRAAILVESKLLELQINRLAQGANICYFSVEEEAVKWLAG